MGFSDIVYEEINRWRDGANSDNEKKKAIANALNKTLKKFEFLWEDQILKDIYSTFDLKDLFSELSGDFLNLAMEIDEILNDEEIVRNLRTLSTNFRVISRKPPVTTYQRALPSEMGRSLAIINQIKEKLREY